MPDERKRELVALLAQHDIPLIEDDVYGDLAFGPDRPSAGKAFDEKGGVLYCSSFSKTLAPGSLFSTTGRHGNCLRLNAAFWSERVDKALETVGEMVGRMIPA